MLSMKTLCVFSFYVRRKESCVKMLNFYIFGVGSLELNNFIMFIQVRDGSSDPKDTQNAFDDKNLHKFEPDVFG